ncbi:MAG: TrkA C-terminal domain-containing protein [Gloeotrichia echinulata IR180]|nr:TrkA C-terminal domain-containing protein [Gloeotrichia echinulata DEX184]
MSTSASPLIGMTLQEADMRYLTGASLMAIRRDGKFIRSPNGKIDLRTGDQVLLCGDLPSLNQIQPLFVHTSALLRSIPVVKVDQPSEF